MFFILHNEFTHLTSAILKSQEHRIENNMQTQGLQS